MKEAENQTTLFRRPSTFGVAATTAPTPVTTRSMISPEITAAKVSAITRRGLDSDPELTEEYGNRDTIKDTDNRDATYLYRTPPSVDAAAVKHRSSSLGLINAAVPFKPQQAPLEQPPEQHHQQQQHHVRAQTVPAAALPAPPVPSSAAQSHRSHSISETSLNGPQSNVSSSSVYACPICGQATKNLLHLNHHLDNVHSIPVESDFDDPGKLIMNWFKKTGENAHRVLKETGENLGLKKTASSDVLNAVAEASIVVNGASNALVANIIPKDGSNFDLNPNDSITTINNNKNYAQKTSPRTSIVNDEINPDSQPPIPGNSIPVTQKHWQPDSDSPMSCAEPNCPKFLVASGVKMGKMVLGAAGVGSMRVHCRKCGKVFCEEHVGLQMRLRPSDAIHDARDGVWCRVCLACFESQDGYFDSGGVKRTRTATFLKARAAMADVVALEVNKLELRYEKLCAIYIENPPKPPSKKTLSRLRNSVMQSGPNYRDLEQSVVAWQDDGEASSCPICSCTFSAIFNPMNRKHHCRLCGRVVCGLETCLSSIELSPTSPTISIGTTSKTARIPPKLVRSIGTVTPRSSIDGEKFSTTEIVVAEVKACTECRKLVFRRKNAIFERSYKPDVVILYEEYLSLKLNVEELLPKFNELVMILSSQKVIKMNDHNYLIASRHRKSLMDYFATIEKLGKRIKAIPAESPRHQKVQDNIQVSVIQFLQANMFTLSLMPKVTTPAGADSSNITSKKSNGKWSGEEEKFATVSFSVLQRIDAASKALEVMEAQESGLQVQLSEAMRRRRLEDAGALREALGDVGREIEDTTAVNMEPGKRASSSLSAAANVTLLDLYNFHLASSPQSPVAASFLGLLNFNNNSGNNTSGAERAFRSDGSRIMREREVDGDGEGEQQQQQQLQLLQQQLLGPHQQQLHSAKPRMPSSLAQSFVAPPPITPTAKPTVPSTSTTPFQITVPPQTSFLCCGVPFKTFALLAKHYDLAHSGADSISDNHVANTNNANANAHTNDDDDNDDSDTDVNARNLQARAIGIPVNSASNLSNPSSQLQQQLHEQQQQPQFSLMSFTDLLSFPGEAYFTQPPLKASLSKQLPQTVLGDILADSSSVLPVQQPLKVVQGKSQLSMGLMQQRQPSPATSNSSPSPELDLNSPAASSNNSIFKSMKSADAMFTSSTSDDIDATLSALLSQPSAIDSVEQLRPTQVETPPQHQNIGKAIATSKRNLSSAAFSLGSYTAADLKKLRTEHNLSGIDIDWLLGGGSSIAQDGNNSFSLAGASELTFDHDFSSINQQQQRQQQQQQRKQKPLVQNIQQQQEQQQSIGSQDLFQSMAIPAHIGGELAKPIDVNTLTPEVYLRMLLEAHHLVGAAHTYLGYRGGGGALTNGVGYNIQQQQQSQQQQVSAQQASEQDFQAIARNLVANGIRPESLTNEQVTQIVVGIQGIDINGGIARNGIPGNGVGSGGGGGGGIIDDAMNLALQQQLIQRQLLQQQQQMLQQQIYAAAAAADIASNALRNISAFDALAEQDGGQQSLPQQPPQSPKVFTCPHCQKKYKSHSGYRYHLDHQHSEVEVSKAPISPVLSLPSQQQQQQQQQHAQHQQQQHSQPQQQQQSQESIQVTDPEVTKIIKPELFSGLAAANTPVAVLNGSNESLFGADGMPRRQIHPSQLNKQFKCAEPGCLKSYKNKGGLKYHREHEHGEKK
ncbi:carboxypeptidase Y-deficient [Physocladia obscura]|uniref:Carboxypeptidase Y-deficient n=1 Tax=Physocladia obscura TaxID=109957 RepID=A0AAD5T3X4_9FUNG|nr:carboxypeptidase Y-deficient [Physocladia obscura]